MKKRTIVALISVFVIAFSLPAADLVPEGGVWKYLVTGTAAPADWATNGFNDAEWASGAAEIGYGDGGEATVIGFGPDSGNKYPTTYFRYNFTVTNPATFGPMTLAHLVDDGAVFYLNGREVARVRMPQGPVTYTTWAATADDYARETIPVSGTLIEGVNVLAVEVHQANGTSSDLSMNVGLSAELDLQGPTLTMITPAPGSTTPELRSIDLVFNEGVEGIQKEDLLINGTVASDVVFFSGSQVRFQFTQPANGTVQITWAANHGITDANGNAFVSQNWSYTLDPTATGANIIITEFMADNDETIRDEDGDASDWIEIFNAGANPVNLAGWSLTDATNNLTKWSFPAVTINPNSFMLIFASGKDRTNVIGRLHTDFRLSNNPEGYLALVDDEGNVVSEFRNYPAQREDVSYGRDRIDPNIIGFFTVPTPGAPNSTSGGDFGPEVHFSTTGRAFTEPFSLTLSTPDNPEAEIRYILVTTASTENQTNIPTQISLLYTGAIQVANTLQVRARAFIPNSTAFPGPPSSESYIRVTPELAAFTSDLPLVVLHTIGASGIPGGGGSTADAHAIVAAYEVQNGRSSLMDEPQLIRRGGINARGSSTQGYPKQSFSVEIWDEFNQDDDASFLGLPAESDWVLYAPNHFDKVLMHNPVAYEVSRQMGRYASRTRFVELFLNTSGGTLTANLNASAAAMGNYNGIYVLEESVKRSDARVDVAALQPEHTNAPAITGGYILKIDRVDSDERTFTAGNQGLIYAYPDSLEMVTPQRAAQAAYIRDYINAFYAALTGPNGRDPNIGYAAYVDVPAWIDHNMIGVLTMNADWMRLSGFMYKDRNGKLITGPVWDHDRSQGTGTADNDWRAWSPFGWNSGAPLGGGGDYGTDFFNVGNVFGNPWYSRMFTDPNFWQAWIDRYQDFRKTAISDANITHIIDTFADEVRNAQPRELARWAGNQGANTAPRSGTITATGNGIRHNWTHTFDGTYQGEVDFLKRWWLARMNFIDTNLLNSPMLSRQPGQVNAGDSVLISAPGTPSGTTIYYTTDGTDPRASGGGISPSAQVSTGSITINDNTLVIARAFNSDHRNLTGANNPPISSPWSGKTEATYFTHRPALLITEIMYHPQEVSASDTNAPDDYEFIEIKNIGSTPINLARFAFIEGIQFNFSTSAVTSLAPGAYAVVVRNETAFTQRYGTGRPVAGRFTGTLDNDGELITLIGAAREPVQSIRYSPNWYPITDGFGFSLNVRDENADPDPALFESAANWRISSVFGGTPGTADGPAVAFPAVFVNEALTRSVPGVEVDTIELFNSSSQAVNVGGWYLTDDLGTPLKYRIPAGTMIAAGGYLVITEDEFGGTNGFGLSSSGDELYLFSGDGTNITGYFHGFEYGQAATGVSFGRHVTSTSEEHFVPQSRKTFGAANSGPLVGPIVISEIHYHPPDRFVNGVTVNNSEDEFIELHNIGDTAVTLADSQIATNTWRFRESTDFDFPENTTIPAGGYLLVVGFNPATNATLTAEWRNRFGVPSNVQILGPLKGILNNSGDSVELARPDAPNTDGSVPQILVEQVEYMDNVPWPVTPDGFGHALQRVDEDAYANDPGNWAGGAPNPGREFTPGPVPRIIEQPQNTIGIAFTNLVLNVTAENAVFYQWQFNGQNIPGGNSATLVVPNLQTNQAGEYRVIVLSDSGSVVSSNATVTVRIPANILEHPGSRDVRTTLGVTNILTNITFTVSATSSTPISYQWRKNGVILPGETNTSLTITNLEVNENYIHFFDVMVTDAVATRLSFPAIVNILINPVFLRPPQPVYAFEGDTIRVDAVVGGSTTDMGFRWRKRVGGSAVHLAFTAEPVLILENVTTNDSTPAIDLVATNLANFRPGVLSPSAVITIWADNDGDRLPDILEAQYGFNPNVAEIGGDADADGLKDSAEFIAGTNPTNATSVLQIATFNPRSTNGLPTLQFTTAPTRSYTVEATSDLNAGWFKVADVNSATAVRTITVTDSNATTNVRFYRLVTPMRASE